MDRGRRKRTKTFTGCWTCRARRVKCDEQKPSCQRCSQFGVACQGYGVRLSWLTIENQDPAQLDSDDQDVVAIQPQYQRHTPSRRSSGNVRASHAPRLSSPEIDGMLERIDECPAGHSRNEKGVFSVFTAQTSSPTPRRPIAPAPSTPDSSGRETSYSTAAELPTPRLNYIATTISHNHLRSSGQDVQETSSATPSVPGRLANGSSELRGSNDFDLSLAAAEQTESVGLYPLSDVAENSESGELHQAQIALVPQPLGRRATQPAAPPSTHLDLLSMPASQKRLIHHWVTFTSKKLVLLDEPHNPCRTMMLPMALNGLMSSSAASTADIAVFHAICACAAYNLYELGGRGSERDRVLALRHDQEAIHHLRHNLAQADLHRDQSFAMAIMACITIEAISGNTRRWRAHVAGGLAYLGKLRSRGAGLEMMSSAFQSHMVSMAILCGCDVEPELKSFLQGADGLELAFPYYGVSSSFLRNQDRLNVLVASPPPPQPPPPQSTSTNTPENDADRELDAFELQLFLNFPAASAAPSGLRPAHAAVVHHVAQAFYYASLVLFQRAVRGAAAETVQELVDNGLAQLEAIEEATAGGAGSVMLWPAWILAAECATPELQARAAAWLRAKRRLGFRNLAVLHEVAAAVWQARARGDEDTTWQDLVAEERFDVFRL